MLAKLKGITVGLLNEGDSSAGLDGLKRMSHSRDTAFLLSALFSQKYIVNLMAIVQINAFLCCVNTSCLNSSYFSRKS